MKQSQLYKTIISNLRTIASANTHHNIFIIAVMAYVFGFLFFILLMIHFDIICFIFIDVMSDSLSSFFILFYSNIANRTHFLVLTNVTITVISKCNLFRLSHRIFSTIQACRPEKRKNTLNNMNYRSLRINNIRETYIIKKQRIRFFVKKYYLFYKQLLNNAGKG